MDGNRFRHLLAQYFDNTISRQDCEELLGHLDEADPAIVSQAIDHALKTDRPTTVAFDPDKQKQVYNQLVSEIHKRQAATAPSTHGRRLNVSALIKVAALLAAVLSVAILLYTTKQPENNSIIASANNRGIVLPDHNQAILTLADGRTIVLSDSLSGVLAQESGVKITMTQDGSVLYEAQQADIVNAVAKYNTFSTPKGHTYQLLLPDGTKVWLNTASSIHYPMVFTGHERTVSLNGEAYFEVAHDASKPFKVEANGSTIQVLGTHFNVSAYAEEQQVTTTLVEGAVNVSKNDKTVMLKPGQQAVVDGVTGTIQQSTANVLSVVAWKNGYFRFDDESIEDIIDKISRWYDIEAVEYRGQFGDRFSGTFQRSKNVSQLFSGLEKLAPIRFEIDERRVVIMK